VPSRQHEIPTHLNVEDKLMFGLTMRQFLYLLVGSSLAYALWEHAAGAPDALRLTATAVCLILAIALALVQPFGRPLEEWLLAAGVYFSLPRRASWRPSEPDAADWRPAAASWQELAPDLVWAEDDEP
jgi:hypothetical protein